MEEYFMRDFGMKLNFWYAVLKDEKDEWWTGSTDLEEAKQMAIENGPNSFIAVIDDFTDHFNPVCIKEIHQDEF